MKKIKILLLAGMSMFTMHQSAAQVQVFSISTGWNQAGGYPLSGLDPEWQVLGPTYSTFSQTTVAWSATDPGECSYYIRQSPGNSLPGLYTYRFNFTPSCEASHIIDAKIIFDWTDADDYLDRILLNNSSTTVLHTYPSPQPGHTSAFVKNSHYTINIPPSAITNGVNSLDFEVYNMLSGGQNTPNWLNVCARVEITYMAPITPVFTTASSVCAGDQVHLYPSTTNDPTINNHVWIVAPCDASGNLTGAEWWSPWFAGVPVNYTLPSFSSGGPNMQCGSYYLIKLAAQNPCSVWGETTQMVYVNCPPVVDAGPDITLCSGDCAVLTELNNGVRGNSFSWYDPSYVGPGKSISVCPTTNKQYCVTVTNSFTGCSSSDCMNVFVESVNPTFSTYSDPSNINYLQITATPVTNTATGFNATWYIDELNSAYAIVNTYMLPSCWGATGAEVFDGFNGITGFLSTFCTPSTGRFKYNTPYRITRVVESQYCSPTQHAQVLVYNRSSNGGITFIDDPNAPDKTNYDLTHQVKSGNDVPAISKFNLYPNPADQVLSIEYALNENANGSITLTDLSGRIIKTVLLNSNDSKINIDINEMLNGAYLVHLFESGKLITTEKVIIAR